ncbi:hypothetical protein G8O24_03150 [Bradyrhizobium sp. INPA01-394B]|uniref:Uncharacterized protein n=1 Tax=Bradyrhizobium campsiandrae TaxID=1729892 RepID=A0ABR7U7W2_9BRAD|nr:hypothetical protein [Bradyrhizobium campsiandrae]MBC9876342.1 hypothetical protein [Bradyrhizobium campsiandrae]MBC9980135.1 hypothetical protein [Bradyrhizobium campsiandrae]
MRNGSYVVAPISGEAQTEDLYSDASGSNRTPGAIANPNNYLVVPRLHDEASARRVADTIAGVQKVGALPALAPIAHSFEPDGPEDLQRHPRWGIPPDSFVKAYVGPASDQFGYVLGAAGLPRELAEAGGGIHNLYSWLNNRKIDVSGKYFLTKSNEANIAQGYAAGAAARRSPTAYNDYGYPTPSQDPANTGGDGKGVLSFPASLAGVNPDEPSPAAWPPKTDAPIRYLSSYRAPY